MYPSHKDTSRPLRVAALLKRELAELLQHELADPRIQHITLTDVEVSRDLARAKVFFSCGEGAQASGAIIKVLDKAAGFLRHQLKDRLVLRGIPNLRFIYDKSIEEGAHIDELIERIHRPDAPKTPESN